MNDFSSARKLIETVKEIAIYLTNDEVTEISEVLLKALDRMEKESKERG